MDYETEQEYLRQLYDEVETDVDAEDDDTSLASDHEEIQDHNTDDEQDIEPEEYLDYSGMNRDDTTQLLPYYLAKDGTTKWRKHTSYRHVRTRAENIIKFLPGVKGNARELITAVDIWSLFFTDEILHIIVKSTNIYIGMSNVDPNNRTAKPTDILELKAFIGLLYICAMSKNNHVNAADLFRTNGTSMEIFRLTMSVARFRFLLRHIRFDDKNTRLQRQNQDKLAPIREVFDAFNSNLCKYFCISELTTVDEMLAAFRGKCGFRVYMPNKPNRYGIKIYSLVDAKMFYTCNMEIYVGQQPIGPYKVQTDNVSLLSRLCQPISGSNRNVTMDNFFTSMVVANKLLGDHKLTMLGTIRKNKRELPKEITQPTPRPDKTSMFAFQEKATIVSYMPRKNKNVILLSTMHHNDDKLDEVTGKPEMVIDYNKTKGGVDTVDKMCAAYNTARCTRRWPMVIFYTALNIAGINSFVIRQCNLAFSDKTPRRLFLESLGMQLLDGHIRRRANNSHMPRTIRFRLKEILGIEDPETVPAVPETTRGRCSYCDRKKNRPTRFRCTDCHKYICLEHASYICNDCTANEVSED